MGETLATVLLHIILSSIFNYHTVIETFCTYHSLKLFLVAVIKYYTQLLPFSCSKVTINHLHVKIQFPIFKQIRTPNFLYNIIENNLNFSYVNMQHCVHVLHIPTWVHDVVMTRRTYMQSRKQCALPVITTMALWQLMNLGT